MIKITKIPVVCFLAILCSSALSKEPSLTNCDRHLLTVERDGSISAGGKKALVDAYRKGKVIRIGWELDWDDDKKVDITHWTSAQFLSEFEGEIFAQVPSIQQQIPRKKTGDIIFPEKSQKWFGILSSTGVLKGRFSNVDGGLKDYRVKSIWCLGIQ